MHSDPAQRSQSPPQSLAPPPYEEWLRLEFRENFAQLRDHDAKILDLLKFYIGAVLSVIGVSVTLLGVTSLDARQQDVGLLLLATAVLGEMVFVWLTALRRYFVTCARQLNAIRSVYSSVLSSELRKSITQPTDPSYPKLVHARSAHIVIAKLVTYVNAVLAATGTAMIAGKWLILVACWLPLALAAIAFGVVAVLNLHCVLGRLKEADANP